MSQVQALLARVLGLDPASLGTTALRELVDGRLRARGLPDEASYLRLLDTDKEEYERLLEGAVVHETWFFREPTAFECLRTFAEKRAAGAGPDLRVLSVPCSTGEEPYSIAMTLLDAGFAPSAFAIEAVDVSELALSAARRAVYGKNSFRGGQRAKEAYFTRHGSSFELRESVRQAVHFSAGNLLDPSFFVGQSFDIIFCKNLLIYFDRAARKAALARLDRLLAPNGLLFAGHSESQEYLALGFERFGPSGSFAFRRPAREAARPLGPVLEQARSAVRPGRDERSGRRSSAPPLARVVAASPGGLRKPLAPPATKLSEPSPADENLAAARDSANRGAIAEATRLCEAYLKGHAESAEGHCLLGLLKQSFGDLAAARSNLERAVYLDPESHEALVHLALLYDQLGDRNSAAQLRRRADRCLKRKAQA